MEVHPCMISRAWKVLLVLLLSGTLQIASAKSGVPDQDIENFFSGLKKGDYLRVELQNGSTVIGKFTEYDDYNGRLWLTPDDDTGGLFGGKSVRLTSIRHIELTDAAPKPSIIESVEDPRFEFLPAQ